MVLNEKIFNWIYQKMEGVGTKLHKKVASLFTFEIKNPDAMDKKEFTKRFASSLFIVFLYFFIIGFGGMVYNFVIMLFAMLAVLEIYELTKPQGKQGSPHSFATGVMVVFLTAYSLITIRLAQQGLIITFWLFMVVAINDTVAYLLGKQFGKTKILPHVSPGKTKFGSVAGAIASISISMLFYVTILSFRVKMLGIALFLLLSMYATFTAQLGDALQSHAKRKFRVKNMGNIIPGHGGITDRFDSMIVIAPSLTILLIFTRGLLF